MKLILFLSMLCFFSGCQNRNSGLGQENTKPGTSPHGEDNSNCLPDEWYSQLQPIQISAINSMDSIKAAITDYWITNRYEDFKIEYIVSLQYVQGAIIEGFGTSKVFELIYLSNKIPSMAPHKEILLIQEASKLICLFPINKYYLIQRTPLDNKFLIGGIIPSKTTGFLVVYTYNKGHFNTVFDSMSECVCSEGGMPVTNSSIECYSYDPFELVFQNKDMNNDGLLDLKFEGEFLSFCEEGEIGYGREDRPPLNRKPLELIFYGNKNQSGLFWEFRDSTLCGLYMQ